MDFRILAGLLLLLTVPVAAQAQDLDNPTLLSDMQGHLILGPTFVAFESVPPVGGIVGLGGTAHQRALLFDVQLLYTYGAAEQERNFTGIGFLFGIGYKPIETSRTRGFVLLDAGWAAVGVSGSGGESSAGPIIAPGVGFDWMMTKTPSTRWSVFGLRLSYHQYFQDPRSGIFLSFTIGQAFTTEARGCNCSGI